MITPEALKAPEDEEDIFNNAPNFRVFFEELRDLLCDNVVPEDEFVSRTEQLTLAEPPISHTSELSSASSKKRPNPLTITTSSPTKMRPTIPTTPDQPTSLRDPKYSGDSRESTHEDNTTGMIRTFLRTILSHLGKDFRRLSWPSYALKCRLAISGSVKSIII